MKRATVALLVVAILVTLFAGTDFLDALQRLGPPGP